MKKIVFFTGASCTGKSTAIKRIQKAIPESYLVSYDKLKWLQANYHRDLHKAQMKRITFGMLEVASNESPLIILDLFRPSEKEFQQIEQIAQKTHRQLITFHFMASEETILERFKERIASAEKAGSKVSVKDPGVFKENLNKKHYLPKEHVTINSDELSIEEMTTEILKHIN
jgi:thymidylate kinase